MRGIVLAGGTGSRLGSLTKAVNKHLLPVYDRPMILWPIQTLKDNGILDITIVSTPKGIGQLAELLGGGYTYRVQDQPGGIAQAILCAADKSAESIAVILGDNVFLPSPEIPDLVDAWCFLHHSPSHDLRQFGVPQIAGSFISEVVEKPKSPPSNYVVAGLYVFDSDVFDVVLGQSASGRGEYEVADLLNHYANHQTLNHLFHEGFWGDAGTIEGLAECSAACAKFKG